jgi:hypothetical protein
MCNGINNQISAATLRRDRLNVLNDSVERAFERNLAIITREVVDKNSALSPRYWMYTHVNRPAAELGSHHKVC